MLKKPKSPMILDLPPVPSLRHKAKTHENPHKPLEIPLNLLENSPIFPEKPHHFPEQSPFLNRTPEKTPQSGAFKAGNMRKSTKRMTFKEEATDLHTEDLENCEVIDEKELNILRFLEESEIFMANPKEKQFEYFENVKKNAFLFFAAVDRSKSEHKRFSLDSSSLLNKRRASLPRLNVHGNSEEEEVKNSQSAVKKEENSKEFTFFEEKPGKVASKVSGFNRFKGKTQGGSQSPGHGGKKSDVSEDSSEKSEEEQESASNISSEEKNDA